MPPACTTSAVGCSAASRCNFVATTTAWRANLGAFSLFALVLTIIMLVWARASLVTFALFFSCGMPTLEEFRRTVVSIEHMDFLVTYLAVGAIFAAIVFAVSVVSVPMMLDRGTDTIVAALTSVRTLFANPLPLLLWALLIVVVIGAGFATFFVGLIVAVRSSVMRHGMPTSRWSLRMYATAPPHVHRPQNKKSVNRTPERLIRRSGARLPEQSGDRVPRDRSQSACFRRNAGMS